MNIQKSNKKKLLIAAAVVLVLVGGGTGTYLFTRSSASTPVAEVRKPTINYGPATPAEKEQTEDNKDRIVKEQNQETTPTDPSQKKSVLPTVTGTTGSIKAYVSGIFEEGGTCTATFTKDGTTLSRASAGFQNVSYTQCAPINISDGFLSPGTWSMVVAYSSSAAEGKTTAQNIEVN